MIHRVYKLWAVLLAASAVTAIAAISSPLIAFAAPGFDDDDPQTQWKVFFDCHPVTSTCPSQAQSAMTHVSSPSTDGQSLKISFVKGDPFMGVDAFRPFPAVPSARRFQLNYKFFFQNQTPIQALEFAANQYITFNPGDSHGWRYEWALQWLHNDPTPQIRIWDGSAVKWREIGFPLNLANNTWYDLQLNGDIQGAPGPLFVHYIDFTIWPDGTTKPAAVDLSSHSFGAQQCPSTCSAIIPAVQLDGDSTPHPYDLFIDEAHIFWA